MDKLFHELYIRNCDLTGNKNNVITNDSISVYVDGIKVNHDMNPAVLKPGEVGEITVKDLWKFSLGEHVIKVVSGSGIAMAEKPVEFVPEIIASWNYPDFSGWSCNPSCTLTTCGTLRGMLGGYNGEYAQFYFDGNKVWEKRYYGNQGTQQCGPTGYWWHELKENICVEVSHSGGTATLRFTSTLNQVAGDEWWGINNITIYQPIMKLEI